VKRPTGAGAGLKLWPYIKDYEQPESLVRVQLDRGELRYAWKSNGNLRTSDDGGPLPPKGWWLSTFTTIDHETSDVRSPEHLAPLVPFFPPMHSVRVFPAIAAANPPPEPNALAPALPTTAVAVTGRRKRAARKHDVVLEILANIDRDEGLSSDLTPAEIENKVLLKLPRGLYRRWLVRRPDGRLPKKPISRKVINEAYQEFLRRRDGHGGDERHGGGAALARPARSSK
jgi:hypothetical protein